MARLARSHAMLASTPAPSSYTPAPLLPLTSTYPLHHLVPLNKEGPCLTCVSPPALVVAHDLSGESVKSGRKRVEELLVTKTHFLQG